MKSGEGGEGGCNDSRLFAIDTVCESKLAIRYTEQIFLVRKCCERGEKGNRDKHRPINVTATHRQGTSDVTSRLVCILAVVTRHANRIPTVSYYIHICGLSV